MPLVLRVACCFACHQAELGPLVFIVFVHYDRCGALVCLFITISLLDLSSLTAIRSL